MRMQWLGLLTLLIAAPVFAATSTPTVPHACADQRSFERQAFAHDMYAAPGAVSHIMLAATDGDAGVVRAGLMALPPKEARRWSPNVLDTAVFFDQPATAAALMDGGISPNAPVIKMALKPAAWKALQKAYEDDPRMGPVYRAFKANGMLRPNGGGPTWRPIFSAIACHELAVTKLLLRHGANPNYAYNDSQFVPLLDAVVEQDAPIVSALLNAGADVCAENQRLTDLRSKHHEHAIPNQMTSIARHVGLPRSLVQRLTCHAPPAPN